MKFKNRKGFTLIEILMVVIIIGVLASLALPQYTRLVERAKISEAKATLAAIKTAQKIYFAEHDSYTTTTTDLSVDDVAWEGTVPGTDHKFEYKITSTGAEATRVNTSNTTYSGYKITLDYDSNEFGGTGGYATMV